MESPYQSSKEEAEIQRGVVDDIDIVAGEMTVAELVKLYISLKKELSQNTIEAYETVVRHIEHSPFGAYKVNLVKLSHVEKPYVDLYD